MILLLLLACNCDNPSKRLDPACPCMDYARLLDGGNGSKLQCRADQHLEWGPTPEEDGNVGAVCECSHTTAKGE